MKIINCEQGSPEWEALRLGRPTASQTNRILTPKTLKLSSQRFDYRNQLLAEWLLGYAIDWSGSSQFMDRGREMEPQARAYYEFQNDAEVELVGFVLRDDEAFGGSPDGLVGSAGLLEVKCPAINTHIGYLLEPDALAAKYAHQVQSYLMLTGREWADILSYNPELPAVVVRVEPDAAYQTALAEALDTFITELAEARAKLEPWRAMGVAA